MLIKLKPIGVIRSPFKTKEETPIQPFKSDAEGRVEVYEKYAAGLEGIGQFSHGISVYYKNGWLEGKI